MAVSKDVQRTKCQALTIVRLTHSPYTTKIARKRCHTILSTIFECKDVQHTISAYIKCQDVQYTIRAFTVFWSCHLVVNMMSLDVDLKIPAYLSLCCSVQSKSNESLSVFKHIHNILIVYVYVLL